jgi:HD superfamily phosphohydrolase
MDRSVLEELLKKIQKKYEGKSFSEAWDEEKNKVEQLIESVYEALLKNSYDVKECLAVAGSRIVFQIENKVNHKDYALKISRPLEDSVGMLQEEYSIVNELYHPNLIQIIDKKDLTIPGDDIKYLTTVEEFVPGGLDLDKWIKTLEKSTLNSISLRTHLGEFSEFIAQLSDVLSYLHSRSIYHCDIKPENILIKDLSPKLVDFGYSHRIYPKNGDIVDRVGYSWDYALPKLHDYIKSFVSKDAVFSSNEGDISYMRMDQYALGRTIEHCIGFFRNKIDDLKQEAKEPEDSRSEFFQDIIYEIKYLELIALRLKGVDAYEDKTDRQNIPTRLDKDMIKSIQFTLHYSCWAELKTSLRNMKTDNLATLSPEWQNKLGSTIRVGTLDVPFTTRIRKLVNHVALSRLSNVSQLGLISFVYPSAKHSRLEHSLGTYYYALQYIKALWEQKDDPIFRCLSTIEELESASLGALFHDLGQYPHAHDIEDSTIVSFRHDQISYEIYRREFSTFAEKSLFELVKENWRITVPELVNKYLDPAREVAETNDIVGNILKNVISSSIDADKLDYLQRDATNLGLKYSSSVEIERLILSLRPAISPSKTNSPPLMKLGVTRKGFLSARSLIVARENMFERVYWHKTVRSLKSMLFTAIMLSDESDKKQLREKIRNVVLDDKFFMGIEVKYLLPESFHLTYSDIAFLNLISESVKNESSKNLLELIFSRKPYKRIFDLAGSDWEMSSNVRDIDSIIDKLNGMKNSGRNGLEQIRQFQKKLNQNMFEKIEIKLNNISSEIANQIGFIIDIPPQRIMGEYVYLVDTTKSEIKEVDPSSLLTGKKEGWISSLSPRIYMHPNLEFVNKPDSNDYLSILKHSF